MPFFTFRQNNSGGSFEGFVYVCIEAADADEANEAAAEYGIYFNGVDKGLDCPCCGDRWTCAWDSDGTAVPMIYGRPADESDPQVLIVYA